MRTLGLAVSINRGLAVVSAVLLDDHLPPSAASDLTTIEVVEKFEVKADSDDPALQVAKTSKAIRGRIQSLHPDRVAVRRADRPLKPSNTEGPRTRLLVEGGITASAFDIVDDTTLRSGKSCGSVYGKPKAELTEPS